MTFLCGCNGFMVHILVVFGVVWLSMRLLQWGKFFRASEVVCAMTPSGLD